MAQLAVTGVRNGTITKKTKKNNLNMVCSPKGFAKMVLNETYNAQKIPLIFF